MAPRVSPSLVSRSNSKSTVERTFAWLVQYRRLTVDFELLRETSQGLIRGAMIHLMLRRPHPQG